MRRVEATSHDSSSCEQCTDGLIWNAPARSAVAFMVLGGRSPGTTTVIWETIR